MFSSIYIKHSIRRDNKNKLKEVLGKYYKDSERSYFVRGVNTKQYTLLLECVYNNHFRGRIVYNEHYEEMSLESFFTNANLTESTAMEHIIAKKPLLKILERIIIWNLSTLT